MLKANFTTGTEIPANTDLPLTIMENTNRRARVNNNTVEFLRSGDLYTVNAILVANASAAAPVTAQLFRNGTAVPGALATAVPAAVGDAVTLPMQDAFRIVAALYGDLANISVRCTAAVTPVGGNIIVKFER